MQSGMAFIPFKKKPSPSFTLKSEFKVILGTANWPIFAFAQLCKLPKGWTGTAEDARLELTQKRGLPDPEHHNSWGSLILHAKFRKVLIPTGTYRHMKTEKSHARKTEVYVRA
jgi:hypothetical protein